MRSDRPSSTALIVASAVLSAAEHPQLRTLLLPGAEMIMRQLLATVWGPGSIAIRTAARFPWGRVALKLGEQLSAPGIIAHLLLRKKKLAAWAATACEHGVTQIVVIGAGLDPLGLLLAQAHPQLRVFEIDHPATQGIKKQTFDRNALAQPGNFHLISADLRQKTAAAVLDAATDFSWGRATLFVAEGLFMYLSQDQVSASIGLLKQVKATQAFFAFTYFGLRSDGRPGLTGQSPLVGSWLKLFSEPFQWGIAPEALADFLRAQGYALLDHCSGDDLAKEYLVGPFQEISSARGEHLALISNTDTEFSHPQRRS